MIKPIHHIVKNNFKYSSSETEESSADLLHTQQKNTQMLYFTFDNL